MEYRREIDGLRALAVIPVILFHTGTKYFSGGYVGVDIFFVISGFLITSILLSELSANQFSILKFYERRARRILPALFAMLLLTSLFAYLLMPADSLLLYSKTLTSVIGFSSNIFFYFSNDYFSPAANENVLLHTWSLAIEEQYYFIFPVFLLLLWRLGTGRLLSLIIFFILVSFGFSMFLTSKSMDSANFYLIFSRAWELLFGSLIAFIPISRIKISAWIRELILFLAFMLIIYAITNFDENTPFPGSYALIPVIGASLIIIFADNVSFIGKLLASRLMVFIGLLSYSLYLWHWPLFSFLRIKTIGEPSVFSFIITIVICCVLAFISWKYIEAPFRSKLNYPRQRIFKYSLISMAVFATIGLVGYFNKGFENRFTPNMYTNTVVHSPKRSECHTQGTDYLKPMYACKYFTKDIRWAVLGDSHIVEPAFALAEELLHHNQGLLHFSFSSCPPALLFNTKIKGCHAWLKESLDYIINDNDIDKVLLGFRHSAYLFGDQLKTYPDIPQESFSLMLNQDLDDLDAQKLYWKSFTEIVKRLRRANKKVYILFPIPELPMHITKAITPFSILSNEPLVNLSEITTVNYYNRRNESVLKNLIQIVELYDLKKMEPYKTFCNSKYCSAVKGERVFYFDDDHLSVFGAKMLVKHYENELHL
ncbi:MAG: acyltransferase family protein [Colwellia sp.]|nr:acyltransferase family protein [Colwellia sp.]